MKQTLSHILISLMLFSCSCGCGDEPQKTVTVSVKTVDGQWSDRNFTWTIPQTAKLTISEDKGSYFLSYHDGGRPSRLKNAIIDYKIIKSVNEVQEEELIK